MSSAADPQDDLRLPRQPGVVRQFWARHERLTDWLIALFWGLPATLFTLAELIGVGHGGTPPWAVVAGTLTVAGASTGVFLRRTRPILALGVLSLALIPVPFAVVSPAEFLPVFGVYSLAVYRSTGSAWVGAAAIEGVSIVYGMLVPVPLGHNVVMHDPLQWSPAYGIELLIALALGATVGNRRRYLAALIDRARQLARERDQQALLSTAAERARIARDMHDVVSHSLTVMITLAEGSAAAAETDARRAATVMRQVADTGREALSGMRQMLGVLGGDGEAALAPQPTSAELPALVARFRELGLPVELQLDGELPGEPAVQLAVYRIAQEGLTNALRYAHGPTRVLVHIDAEADPVRVIVDDDGLPGFATPSVGAGRGLLGAGERAGTLGGTLTAGPHENGGGWRLEAALPRKEN